MVTISDELFYISIETFSEEKGMVVKGQTIDAIQVKERKKVRQAIAELNDDAHPFQFRTLYTFEHSLFSLTENGQLVVTYTLPSDAAFDEEYHRMKQTLVFATSSIANYVKSHLT